MLRFLLSTILVLAHFNAFAASTLNLSKSVHPRDLPGIYKLPTNAFSTEQDAVKNFSPNLLQGKDYVVVDGSLEITAYDEANALYTMYNTRVLYIKRPYAAVLEAVRPFSQTPYPAPLYDVKLNPEITVSNEAKYRTFQFTYKQTYKAINIAGVCSSSNHEVLVAADQTRVQTLLKDCYDPADAAKLVFLEGAQTTDVIKLADANYTAVLFRSLVVAKRNRVLLVLPPLAEMKNAGYEVSNESFRDVLKRIGITYVR